MSQVVYKAYCGSHFSTTSMAQILFNLDKIVFADCFSCFHFFWIKPIHSKRKTFPYIFVTLFFGTLCHHSFCYLSLLPQKWCSHTPCWSVLDFWKFFTDSVACKEIGHEESCYSTKILIFSFIWAGLAALHKASIL